MIPLPPIPDRPDDAHKGTCGHVLVLGGSLRYSGAPVLAARAALRGGAGLATIGCSGRALPLIGAKVLSETTWPLCDDDWDDDAAEAVLVADTRFDVVALGCGLGDGSAAVEFAHRVGVGWAGPLVLDADGLNAFRGRVDELSSAMGPRILTPHPGEAARLLECSVGDVQADPTGAGAELARRTDAVVLLKGRRSTIHCAGRVSENATGSAALATGGTGDVLTGLVAALLAQGLEPEAAAVLGAHLHGVAGEVCEERHGLHGTLAADVVEALPDAFRRHTPV